MKHTMHIKRRTLATLLALCLVLSTIVYIPVFAEGTSKGVATEGFVTLDGVHLDYTNTLTANKDGTYTLRINAHATETVDAKNVDTRVSKNGAYTVERDGRYLVELWGGNGADASETTGKGGDGGYVYGIITLKKGETLYFNLGGNGEKTSSTQLGGGVNGSGGAHGGSGSTTVGGGGGYSALYLFDSADFELRYTDGVGNLTVSHVLESDRVSKYVMIAGGGGGGGAFSGDSLRTPDGGAGGNLSSASGLLSGSEYPVAGTFFAGADGKSSGSSTAYVGKGGTNVPGKVIDTVLSWTDGIQPNDWLGTYNTALEGGAGGAGNLRGGSGGAGYAGGSGGLMTSILIPNNVGGGGGGSSFISDYFTYELTEEEKGFLVGENPSASGGGIAITFIEEHDLSYLSNLSFTGHATEYFHINSVKAENVTLGETYTAHYDYDTYEVYVEDVSAEMGTYLVIEIVFKTNVAFAGGNNVPLVDGSIRVAAKNAEGDTVTSGNLIIEDASNHVNVPLNFSVFVRNHSTNVPGFSHNVTDLYRDDYAAVREALANGTADWHYDRIESVSDYFVTSTSGTVLTGAVAPTETTKYNVSFTVTPLPLDETGVALVGPVVTQKTFTETALVEVAGSNIDVLYGNWVSYAKEVGFDGERYSLSLHVKSDTNMSLGEPPEMPKYEFDSVNVQTTEITYSGYYLFRLWGGNGGQGGAGGLMGTGGAGGKGGFVSGYVYLPAGTVIHTHIGANGVKGEDETGIFQYGTGGTGGHASSVAVMKKEGEEYVVDYYLAVAAGGGGGSASGGAWLPSSPGASVDNSSIADSTAATTLDELFALHNGKDGGKGSGNGGAAGQNVLNSAYMNVLRGGDELTAESLEKIAAASSSDYTNTNGGAFYIDCLQGDLVIHEDEKASVLTGYSLALNLAKYFDFDSVTLVNENGEISAAPTATVTTANGVTTVLLTDIAPHQTVTNTEDGTVTTVDYTVTLYFTPKDGFLGGNDVPLIDVTETAIAESGMQSGMTLSQTLELSMPGVVEAGSDTIDIAENSMTDYVNVAIDFDAASVDPDVITVKDNYFYIIGYDPIPFSELYTLNESLIPTLPDDWRADYVTVVRPDGSRLLSPNEPTFYDVSVGIAPKNPANYAIVADEVEPILYTEQAILRVGYEVIYELDDALLGITADKDARTGKYVARLTRDYEATLTSLSDQNSLPAEIEVTVGGEHLPAMDYTWNSATGEIIIPMEYITGEIHILAESSEILYTIYYIVQKAPGSTESFTYEHEYHAGDAIGTEYLTYTPAVIPTGYKFVWNFGDGSEEPLTVMPAQDYWIVGTYEALSYTLSVRYEDENGTLLGTHEETLLYGTSYSIVHPIYDGYRVKDGSTVLEGTVSGETNITVVYEKLVGILHIVYMKTDTNTVTEERTLSFGAGESYSVASPSYDGYHTEAPAVSGTMPIDGAGVTVYVTYDPNTYYILFDPAGGSVAKDQATVIYGMPYSFDGTYYEALPTPVKVGYVFEGWYLGEALVTDESIVAIIAEDGSSHTLTARYTAAGFSITLRFVLADGTPVTLDGKDVIIENVLYGSPYSYAASDYSALIAPEYADYEVTPHAYTGEMPAMNTVLTFTYYPPVAEDVMSVTVTFGDLTFVGAFGMWDPESLTYEPDVITPETDGASNKITVTNDEGSTLDASVFLQYAKASDYTGIDGYFTSENDAAGRHRTELTAPVGESIDAYLWLTGRLRVGSPEGVCGTVTVTVSPKQ